MKSAFFSAFVMVMLAIGLVPVLADGGNSAFGSAGSTTETTASPDTVPPTAATADPSTTDAPTTTEAPSSETDETLEAGTDSPLVVNGQSLSPETVCAGVDGAVVFIDDDDGIRYIAGFEKGPFLRVILRDGDIMETKDVKLTDHPSGAHARGILRGEFPEATITMYLDDGLDPCPELG